MLPADLGRLDAKELIGELQRARREKNLVDLTRVYKETRRRGIRLDNRTYWATIKMLKNRDHEVF